MLGILLTIIHVLVCFFLVIVVLLQSGKAADLAGAFGGMGSQTAFGPRGAATILSKSTTIAAALFMITSLTLSILATRGARFGSTVLEKQQTGKAQQTAPAKSGRQPAAGKPITVTPEGGGPSTTVPIQLPVAPAPQPASGKPAPAQPAPPKN